MSKGKLLSVAGRIETRSYEAKDGGRRYVIEVIADEVSFLEYGNKNEGQAANDYMPADDDNSMPF